MFRVQSTIIKSTSGTVDAGTLVGIVGPSGSGKTTLLNVLALHKVPGRTMMGSVFYDNQQITQSTRQYVSSYIHQVISYTNKNVTVFCFFKFLHLFLAVSSMKYNKTKTFIKLYFVYIFEKPYDAFLCDCFLHTCF